jgi:hypothetical protein
VGRLRGAPDGGCNQRSVVITECQSRGPSRSRRSPRACTTSSPWCKSGSSPASIPDERDHQVWRAGVIKRHGHQETIGR